jgi:DNA-binding response OmpR family regulator
LQIGSGKFARSDFLTDTSSDSLHPDKQKNMTNFDVEKKRILFVDDDEEAHELMTLTLTDYRLVTARDFTEGLRIARQQYFDLYIFDNWLPDRTGIELCRHIREFDPHTPILFYSAVGYARDIQEAFSVGAQSYLVKPVRLNELKRVIAQLIAGAGKTAVEARLAELAAIREELAIRRME